MAKRKKRKTKRYKVTGKLGTGSRFKKLKKTLARRKGKRKVKNPAALASYIGRKKYGKKKMAKLSAKGRRKRR